jgi:O86/O127-antigen biosynthesis alpha-1,3-N-acetylgalactosaminyltransferase
MLFSVLISTYKNDNSDCLNKALESIFNQSLTPNQVVLVIDGNIPAESEKILLKFKETYSDIFETVRLANNLGLGNALNQGLKYCIFPLVARMDSDDECFFDRFKKQVEYLTKHKDVAVVGSFVEEFITIPQDYGKIKKAPIGYAKIKKYATYRNPLNHPTVMFRKEAIESVGSYKEINLFEDYYLWLRLLKAGYKIDNISESLVYFKIGNDLIGRRHGFSYMKKELAFFTTCRKEGLLSFISYFLLIISRLPMRLLPKKVLLILYRNLLRNKGDKKATNLLYVTTKSEVGGVQKFVKEQIDITANEFDVYLCTNQKDWLTEQTSTKTKGVLLNRSIKSKLSFLFLIRLIIFIKKNKIDLVITNSANAGFYGRVAAWFTKTKSCYYSHGWSSVYNGGKFSFLLNFLEKKLASISNKVICVSKNDYLIALKKIKIPSEKLITIQNTTLPTFEKKDSTPLKEKIQIISLARFAHPKRIDLMIKALEKEFNLELHIAGDGKEFSEWEKYIELNEISNIKLLGEIKSFSNFKDYDIFMLISESEGLPMSAIEAMSAGLPLILSNVGGCPELIEENGILVNNDIHSIKSAVHQISKDINFYSLNSLQLYNTKFNLELLSNKYIETYRNLINE